MLLRNSSSLLRSTRLDSLLSLIGAGASLSEIELFPVSARKLPLPAVASILLLSPTYTQSCTLMRLHPMPGRASWLLKP